MWTERHTTDSDYVCNNAHYIEHEIYVEDGSLWHERKRYEYDDYEQEYELVSKEREYLDEISNLQ